jgi:hypothetical protein
VSDEAHRRVRNEGADRIPDRRPDPAHLAIRLGRATTIGDGIASRIGAISFLRGRREPWIQWRQ